MNGNISQAQLSGLYWGEMPQCRIDTQIIEALLKRLKDNSKSYVSDGHALMGYGSGQSRIGMDIAIKEFKLIQDKGSVMASRTVLKQVDLGDYLPLSHLDRAFNRSGLCAYCEGRYNCSLSEDSGLVYECEDYRSAQDELPPITFSALVDEPEDAPDGETIHGLCAQCQKRDICPLKYIRGGVWHCEEFQ